MRKYTLVIIFSFLYSVSVLAVPFKASEIAISAHCPYAVKAGEDIALKGGNVVDVALTMLLTMAVTNPSFASLGGGAFAMVKIGDKPVSILDFREVAPNAAKRDYYFNKGPNASRYGAHAVAVPGLPLGIETLHKKYGKLHWSRLFRAPIRLAEKGFRVTGGWAQSTARFKDKFNTFGKKYFLKDSKAPYRPGELLKQPQLARALKQLRNRRSVAFYQGDLAKDLVKTLQSEGGSLTQSDLKNYKPIWRKPIIEKFRDYNLYLMPPPSSGGLVMQQAFRLVELMKLDQYPARSANEYHTLGELLKRAYRGRMLLGDPDYHKNPTNFLLSKTYLQKMAKSFRIDKSSNLKALNETHLGKESKETSHLSVLNAKGDAVAMTFTVNGSYGSGVVTKKYGILLNNEMDDFTTRPGKPNMYGLIQGEGNTVAPGKRPLSSMSPTLIEKNKKIIGAIGAPGGPRIISSTFQAIYRLLAQGMDVDTAIQTPRVHHQFLPNTLYVDKNRMPPETIAALKKKRHKVEESWHAKVFAVFNRDGVLEAAYDSRGEGATGGY